MHRPADTDMAATAPVPEPHILVVDDDDRLRALLARYLGANGFRVTTAANSAEARAALANMAFDLLVLDVMMPGENGLDLTRALRAGSGVPIVLLTAMAEAPDRIDGLERGADDYIAKPFEPRELVLRLNAVLRRVVAPEPPPAVIAFGPFRFEPRHGALVRSGQPVRLTGAETALLALLAEAPDTAHSREDLARRMGVQGSPRTVDVQMTRLRRKIEDDPRFPRWLQTVRGTGYRLVPD